MPVKTDSGLFYVDELVGSGDVAESGTVVEVHYTGQLMDGTIFDTSAERGPFQFTLGQGIVIDGWEEGIAGMKVGGRRLLVIPPDLAYGDQGFGDLIPPRATLLFHVDLLSVSP